MRPEICDDIDQELMTNKAKGRAAGQLAALLLHASSELEEMADERDRIVDAMRAALGYPDMTGRDPIDLVAMLAGRTS